MRLTAPTKMATTTMGRSEPNFNRSSERSIESDNNRKNRVKDLCKVALVLWWMCVYVCFCRIKLVFFFRRFLLLLFLFQNKCEVNVWECIHFLRHQNIFCLKCFEFDTHPFCVRSFFYQFLVSLRFLFDILPAASYLLSFYCSSIPCFLLLILPNPCIFFVSTILLEASIYFANLCKSTKSACMQ